MAQDLTLAAQPMYRCCRHCKPAYCPDGAGHYAPCKQGCIEGKIEIEKVVTGEQSG